MDDSSILNINGSGRVPFDRQLLNEVITGHADTEICNGIKIKITNIKVSRWGEMGPIMGKFKNRTLRKSVYAKVEFECEYWSFDRKLLQIAKVQTRDFRHMAII